MLIFPFSHFDYLILIIIIIPLISLTHQSFFLWLPHCLKQREHFGFLGTLCYLGTSTGWTHLPARNPVKREDTQIVITLRRAAGKNTIVYINYNIF